MVIRAKHAGAQTHGHTKLSSHNLRVGHMATYACMLATYACMLDTYACMLDTYACMLDTDACMLDTRHIWPIIWPLAHTP